MSEGRIGVVVIGRNEGERLARCLRSAGSGRRPTVYVDSGSTDSSVETARSLGAHVVTLDQSVPFTAARARNAGLRALLEAWPAVERVQFLDGDCELVAGWIEAAESALDAAPDVAAVCGRRRERAPEASPYNRVTDREWALPPGDTHTFGGDVLIRAEVLAEVGGYRDDMIAGEDPELSTRILDRGWRILRLDRDMTLHDAALHSFRAWWVRQVRAGHSYAELARLTRGARGAYWRGKLVSIAGWGAGPWLLAAGALAVSPWGALLPPLLYAVLFWRVYAPERAAGAPHAGLWALACTVGKLPLLFGVLRYALGRARGERARLIEYKGPEAR